MGYEGYNSLAREILNTKNSFGPGDDPSSLLAQKHIQDILAEREKMRLEQESDKGKGEIQRGSVFQALRGPGI